MSRIQLGEQVKLVSADGSVHEVTVEHLFHRRGRYLASVRFPDSHFEIVDAGNLNPEPQHPSTQSELQNANRALDELGHAHQEVQQSWSERRRQAEEEHRQKVETDAANRAHVMPKNTRTRDEAVKGIGGLLIITLLIAVPWLVWSSTMDCFLADNFDYITKRCALKHLQKPDCNLEQDILDVDEISDTSYKDEKGNRVEIRSVIYQFKKRPLNGPVSADVLRDTRPLYKDAKGHWWAGCERQ